MKLCKPGKYVDIMDNINVNKKSMYEKIKLQDFAIM